MSTILKGCAGVCVKCGSEDLDYDGVEIEMDGNIHYPYTCNHCKHEGNEYYTVTYELSD